MQERILEAILLDELDWNNNVGKSKSKSNNNKTYTMQTYSHKIPDNIMEKIRKIRDKIEEKLKAQPSIDEQLKNYQNAQKALTPMTREQFETHTQKEKTRERTVGEYLVDSYRELVEESLDMKNAMEFFITKLNERNDKELFLFESKNKNKDVCELIRCLGGEISMIVDEYNSMRNAIKEYEAQKNTQTKL